MTNTNIVAFAGAKQAGKSSAVNFIVGMELASLGLVSSFKINEDGKLIVPVQLESGELVEGEWDMHQQELTYEGLMYLDQNVYPFIKTYNFADNLKKIAINLFGLDPNLVYGTDDDKNQLCDIKWEDLPHYTDIKERCKKNKEKIPIGFMTVREFLQELGTGVCRKIKPDCHIKSTLTQIKKEEPETALLGDGRFINEVEAVLQEGGKVIYLTKTKDSKDLHQSEQDLKDFDGFSAVIDNQNMTNEEKNKRIYDLLKEWGYLKFEIVTNTNEGISEYETVK